MKKQSRFVLSVFVFLLASPSVRAADQDGFENRCGWIGNPTPANWDLIDKDGDWIISVQGGYEAQGMDTMPDYSEKKVYWKETNGHYGYGCGCLLVKVDRKEKKILEIKGGPALPLSKCRSDPKIKGLAPD
ncbi:MAG TPA: DUF4087 domain-containing protein [bacterium]|nr:DUF4087 domain-containing protein [bacterium]